MINQSTGYAEEFHEYDRNGKRLPEGHKHKVKTAAKVAGAVAGLALGVIPASKVSRKVVKMKGLRKISKRRKAASFNPLKVPKVGKKTRGAVRNIYGGYITSKSAGFTGLADAIISFDEGHGGKPGHKHKSKSQKVVERGATAAGIGGAVAIGMGMVPGLGTVRKLKKAGKVLKRGGKLKKTVRSGRRKRIAAGMNVRNPRGTPRNRARIQRWEAGYSELTPEQRMTDKMDIGLPGKKALRHMRDWLEDLDLPDDMKPLSKFGDNDIVRFIKNTYDGGLAAFMREEPYYSRVYY
jgi:hypothetical protein